MIARVLLLVVSAQQIGGDPKKVHRVTVLRARYTVVTMTCTPDGTPRP